jgi:hypothetical protein
MVKLLLLGLLFLVVASATYGQTTNTLQPQQFRFQQPPSLDIRPDMNQSPCK